MLRTLLFWMSNWRRPLLVAGGALFLLFFAYHYVLDRAEFAPIAEEDTVTVLTSIVDYVYYVAVFVCALAFLAYTLPRLIPKSVFLPTPTIRYGLVIARLFNPSDTPMGRIMSSIEMFPGFPYFSRESDHPGSWPPRVQSDRRALAEELRNFFLAPEVASRIRQAKAAAGDTDSVQLLTSAPQLDGPAARAERADTETIAESRMFLHQRLESVGTEGVVEILGGDRAREYLTLEQTRARMAASMPNRLAILRLRNTARTTLQNLTVEFELAGSIYDIVVAGMDGDLEKPDWGVYANRVEVVRFQPGLLIEIRVWYWYQELAGRSFPDKIDFIWEACQGMRIANIAVDDGRVEHDARLVSEISVYDTLYAGDGRKKDNYDRDIASVIARGRQAQAQRAASEPQDQHGSFSDVPAGGLTGLEVGDPHIDNVWLEIRSPADRLYRMVFVYQHPNGPYALLSSEDKDADDLRAVQAELAELQGSDASDGISDRGSDLCVTVRAPDGYSVARIEVLTAALVEAGYQAPRYTKVHYTVPA